jgi:hypothetical protein
MSEIRLDTTGLEALIKAFSHIPKARVGVLADKNSRGQDSGNADIGAKHEFGENGMPIRSWLRMPLTTKFREFLENSGAFDKEVLADIIREGSIAKWVEKMGLVGEQTIAAAFASGGFGQWKAHAPGYENNTGMILVDSQQLRNSVSSQVVK